MPVLSAALGAAYLKQGRRWIERGKKTEARTAFQVSLKWDPKRAGPLSELAHLASADGNYEDCIQLANRALAQESSYADALGNRGACRFALGQNSEALKDLDRAIEKQPRSAGIRITRAGVYGALGDCRRLAEDTQIAVAVDPTVTESAQALLTRCRHRTDKN
jgi:tetratricopeptide (TPR) repeat protein